MYRANSASKGSGGLDKFYVTISMLITVVSYFGWAMLQNFKELPYKLHRAVAVAVLALADIAASLYHYFSVGNISPRISWAAHSSGALAGFLLGLVLFKGSKKIGPAVVPVADEEEKFVWTRIAVWVAATLLGAAISAAVICNVLLTPPPQVTD